MPDIVMYNGRVLTQDPDRPEATALAIRAGRVLAAGDDAAVLALAGPGAARHDLGGRCVIPGFNDAHAHLWKIGHLARGMLDLRAIDSLDSLIDELRHFAGRLPADAWVAGRGYNEARMAGGRGPTAADLDRALPGRKVYLTRTCGHIAVASTAALRDAGIGPATPSPAGGEIARDASGTPTGVLNETAMGLVSSRVPQPGRKELCQMILAAARHQLSLGITSSSDAGVTPEQLEAYLELDAGGSLPLRVDAMALRRPLGGTETFPLPELRRSEFLRIDTIKLLADGGLSGATAALRVPYRHCASCGLTRLEAAEIVELSREAHEAGLRIAVHAIGDAAIDEVLEAYEQLGPSPAGVRHRIEHFGLPDTTQIDRAARLRAVAVPQTIFVRELGVNFRKYLPDSLLGRPYPLREMLDRGLTVALSSDAPVVRDDNPLAGIQAAVTRLDEEGALIAPDQAVTVQQALAAYTRGGAEATGDSQGGRLAPGCRADLAVLSADPLSTPPERLTEIRVEATWVAGRVAFER